jgi:hypothetical protein
LPTSQSVTITEGASTSAGDVATDSPTSTLSEELAQSSTATQQQADASTTQILAVTTTTPQQDVTRAAITPVTLQDLTAISEQNQATTNAAAPQDLLPPLTTVPREDLIVKTTVSQLDLTALTSEQVVQETTATAVPQQDMTPTTALQQQDTAAAQEQEATFLSIQETGDSSAKSAQQTDVLSTQQTVVQEIGQSTSLPAVAQTTFANNLQTSKTTEPPGLLDDDYVYHSVTALNITDDYEYYFNSQQQPQQEQQQQPQKQEQQQDQETDIDPLEGFGLSAAEDNNNNTGKDFLPSPELGQNLGLGVWAEARTSAPEARTSAPEDSLQQDNEAPGGHEDRASDTSRNG